MPISYRTRTLPRPVHEEEILERRLERDRSIYDAIKGRRHRRTVARDHGVTIEEVEAAIERIASTVEALEKASPAKVTEPAKWPPARIRNVLVHQFGIPESRTDDPALLAEILSRSGLRSAYYVNEGTVRSIEAFLASHGLVLQD